MSRFDELRNKYHKEQSEYQRKLVEGDPDTLKKEIEKLKLDVKIRTEMYDSLEQEKNTLFYRLERIYKYVMDEKSIDKIFEEKKAQRKLIDDIKYEISKKSAYSCMLWDQWNENEEYQVDPVAYWKDILESTKNGAKEVWLGYDSDDD